MQFFFTLRQLNGSQCVRTFRSPSTNNSTPRHHADLDGVRDTCHPNSGSRSSIPRQFPGSIVAVNTRRTSLPETPSRSQAQDHEDPRGIRVRHVRQTIVSDDGSSLRYDGYPTFPEDSTQFTYSLVGLQKTNALALKPSSVFHRGRCRSMISYLR